MKKERIVTIIMISLLLLVTGIGIVLGFEAWLTSSSLLTNLLTLGTIVWFILTRQLRLLPYALLALYSIIGSITVDKLTGQSFIPFIYNIIGLVGFLWFREWCENHAKNKSS